MAKHSSKPALTLIQGGKKDDDKNNKWRKSDWFGLMGFLVALAALGKLLNLY